MCSFEYLVVDGWTACQFGHVVVVVFQGNDDSRLSKQRLAVPSKQDSR
jgi:hypothetical protein